MYIIGKATLCGKEKELIIKEEDDLLKYYSLELIGIYYKEENKIIWQEDINASIEDQEEIIQSINREILPEENELEVIGTSYINDVETDILARQEDEIKIYYLNLIGVHSPKMPGDSIIFKEDSVENAVSADIKGSQQKNQISPTEKEQLQKFLERIKILEIMDKLQDRGVREKTKYNRVKQEQNNNKKEKENIDKKNQKETLKMQQKQKEKFENKLHDITIKQEIDMDTRVTDMKNLQQVLKKANKIPKLEHGDSPLKMGIVESDDLDKLTNEKGEKERGHSARYETVMITKKGKIKALDLENDTAEGTNPFEKNYQVKQNGTVEKDDVITRLKVGEGTISIDKGKYGEVEVFHSPRKTIGGKSIEGNKSLDRQLETSDSKNILKGTDIETLKLAQEHNDGYRSVEEGYQEIAKHEKEYPNCEEKSVKDLDGDPNTQSHTHDIDEYIELSSGEKVTYDELATRWGLYKDGKPDKEHVKEKFNEKKENQEKKPEEIIEELDEEYEDPRTQDRR